MDRGLVLLLVLPFLSTVLSVSVAADSPSQIDVWIGTGRSKQSKGIYHATLNLQTGRLSETDLVAEISGPGFLAMHPNGRHIYAVGSLEDKAIVAAYEILKDKGKSTLSFQNAVEIGDGGAAHVSIDSTGRTILTAQYGAGSTAVFSVNADGSIKERTQILKHGDGSRAVPGRQDAAHAHWTGFSPDERFAFVPDLGMDKVVIYQADTAKSTLEPHGFGMLPPGAGPRHMKFHTNGKWVYVLNEIDLSVTRFDYDAKAGTMSARETVLTVPKEELAKEQARSCSEIRVHPNGRFVYAANRGHDTVTVFSVDQSTGELTLVERENVRGATPRNVNLTPDGRWLIAAGQDSHTLAVFAVDGKTGELTYNRSNVSAPSPICVLFEHE
ncbi:MAG: lactonase family protein [Rhodopirellula sp.]|nr:lactonase family protein [Rhodopirellula sp.]